MSAHTDKQSQNPKPLFQLPTIPLDTLGGPAQGPVAVGTQTHTHTQVLAQSPFIITQNATKKKKKHYVIHMLHTLINGNNILCIHKCALTLYTYIVVQTGHRQALTFSI